MQCWTVSDVIDALESFLTLTSTDRMKQRSRVITQYGHAYYPLALYLPSSYAPPSLTLYAPSSAAVSAIPAYSIDFPRLNLLLISLLQNLVEIPLHPRYMLQIHFQIKARMHLQSQHTPHQLPNPPAPRLRRAH